MSVVSSKGFGGIAAAADASVVKKGWLRKKGEHLKIWRRRYFVLTSDGHLLGYKHRPDVYGGEGDDAADEDKGDHKRHHGHSRHRHLDEPHHRFSVRRCVVVRTDRPKPFAFAVMCLQMTHVVVRHFHADTEEERREWVEAVRAVKKALDEQTAAAEEVHSRGVALDDFELLKVLGRGAFGKVILCRERATRHLYAMKVLKKRVVIEHDEVEHTLTERHVLQRCRHPFLLVHWS